MIQRLAIATLVFSLQVAVVAGEENEPTIQDILTTPTTEWDEALKAKLEKLQSQVDEHYREVDRLDDEIIRLKKKRLLHQKSALMLLAGRDSPEYYSTTREMLLLQMYTEAIPLLELAHREWPKHIRFIRQLEVAHRNLGHREETKKYQRIALQAGNAGPAEYLKYANQYLSEGKEQANHAIDFLTEAIEKYPQDPQLHQSIAFAYSYTGEHTKVAEHLAIVETHSEAKHLGPDFHFRYGSALEQSGKYEQASERFGKALSLLSEDPDAHNFKAAVLNYHGYMLIERGLDIPKGGELVLEAAELDPANYAIADSVGWYYFKLGDYEQAETHLKRAVELHEADLPSEAPDPVIVDHLAQAYYHLEKYESAIKYGTLALDSEPENAAYRQRLEQYQKKSKP